MRKSKHGRNISDLSDTAYHEAGHAIADWRLGLLEENCTATIVPDKAKCIAGYVDSKWAMTEPPDAAGDEHRVEAENTAISFLAGYAAGQRRNPHVTRASSASDYAYARQILHYFVDGGENSEIYEDEMAAWIKLLELRAKFLIERYWPEVEAVAQRLLIDSTITGVQILETCLASFDARTGFKRLRTED